MPRTPAEFFLIRMSIALGVTDVRASPRLSWKWDTASEAKLHLARIRQIQKELRLLKKDASIIVKQIRAEYATEKAQVGRSGGAAVLGLLFGRKALGASNASAKDVLRRKQINELSPYELVTQDIDKILLQLDGVKVQIDTWLVKHQCD